MRALTFWFLFGWSATGRPLQGGPSVVLSPDGILVEPFLRTIDQRKDHADLPVRLTEEGLEKMKEKQRGEHIKLVAGHNYEIKGSKGGLYCEWVALPNNEFTAAIRHDWVFVRNNRPVDPTFATCSMPRQGPNDADRNAALTMTYFHPWTLHPGEADEHHVPHLGCVCARQANPGSNHCFLGSMARSCVRRQNDTSTTSSPSQGQGQKKVLTTKIVPATSATTSSSWGRTTSLKW